MKEEKITMKKETNTISKTTITKDKETKIKIDRIIKKYGSALEKLSQ